MFREAQSADRLTWLGRGLGALWTVEDTSLSSALNAYVEIALGTGVLGLVPILAALGGAGWLLFGPGRGPRQALPSGHSLWKRPDCSS